MERRKDVQIQNRKYDVFLCEEWFLSEYQTVGLTVSRTNGSSHYRGVEL